MRAKEGLTDAALRNRVRAGSVQVPCGEVKAAYSVMGQYDFVIVSEAPDDETIARISLAAGSQGGVRSETMRAFTEDEYRKIIASLP